MCAVLGVSASGYYAWRGRPLVPPRVRARSRPAAPAARDHAASRGRYGSPRVHHVLQADGQRMGRKRVIRLMRVDSLRGRPRRRFRVTTRADPHARRRPITCAAFHPRRPIASGRRTSRHPDARRLALSGRAARFVVATGGRLGAAPDPRTELVCAAWHMARSAGTRPTG